MTNEIVLYGSVGASWWDEEFFSAATVRQALADKTGPLTVRLNSGGGLAWEGQAIYTMLRDYAATKGEVHTVCDAVAMSAASLIFMAGDRRTVRMGGIVMIHDPAQMFTDGRGTEEDHRATADALAVLADAYADVYAARAGVSREEARRVMRSETYLDGEAAVAQGFATEREELAAVAAARFDYRLYANAPAHLREASQSLGSPKGPRPSMAALAGSPRPHPQEPLMADQETAAEVPAVADDVTEPETRDAATAETAPDAQAPDMTATAQAATAAERARAKNLRAMAEAANLPVAVADDLIDRGVSVEAAIPLILARRKEATQMSDPLALGARTQIVRDERDTRRAGMAQALVAQMRRRDPETDMARPYMGLSLVDMAAACADYRGPVRSVGDKLNVFMAAAHATSDFPGIFENALNKSLLERYTVAQPTYREIARSKTFTDFRAHPMVRAGDFPRLQSIGENGEIKFGTFGEKKETAVLSSYGVGIGISRQMLVNDDLGAIDDVMADYGSMVSDFEEQTFYTFMASATLASDSTAVWHASHSNLAGSGTAITVAALAAGKAAMRKQTTVDGLKMNLAPSILLVGPDKEIEAMQLVAPIQAQSAGNVNPFSGTLRIVVSAQITGNTWYLFADPGRAGGACFVYGYLDGAAAPRVRMEEPFGTQGMKLTVEHDFGTGAMDYRGTYKNIGA